MDYIKARIKELEEKLPNASLDAQSAIKMAIEELQKVIKELEK